ncbi:hypothetical protein Herbaro_02405 [Herbaspirillum sp. WKF16]|uniref:hypothetical protein n=1 Tax=Herbaspirillum sp. WKF16 TaxID=3028312 RepID=UPI0023A9566C|nr:hypothetical protein [Herbaspirillum sp. WKF16]WDZ96655.1 hypothetical protein Herbaro_02405 [Herbaspirillum sp. WKF16]
MTTIAPLSSSSPAYQPAAARNNAVAVAASAAVRSDTVALGAQAADLALYSASGQLANAKSPVWENKQLDTITAQMANTAAAGDLAGRLHGLGRALTDYIGEGGNGYSQSVLTSDLATGGDSGVQSILRDQLQKFAANSIGLSVATAGGAKVNFSLASNSDGIAVKIEVIDGKLTDADREAIRQLGDAFQGAIGGLAQQPPKLALDGLMKFDTGALGSVELNARIGDQAIQLHVDAQQRSLSTSSSAGTMKVAVDLKNTAILGSGEQRQRAIASYLQQFDAASRRGHGDAGLNDLFKDAFSQLNGNYPVRTGAPGNDMPKVAADGTDRQMLSGLADFTASISQATESPNPLRRGETDGFDYQVSQQTSLTGRNQANRGITQEQHSSLKAAWHEALQPDLPLKLGTDKQSQNYTYHQVDDQASSKLEIGYELGYLSKVRLSQSASQNTRVTKYVMGEKVSDVSTPLNSAIVRDFAEQLRDGRDARTADGQYRWQQKLAQIGAMALLQPDPSALKAQGAQALLN